MNRDWVKLTIGVAFVCAGLWVPGALAGFVALFGLFLLFDALA